MYSFSIALLVPGGSNVVLPYSAYGSLLVPMCFNQFDLPVLLRPWPHLIGCTLAQDGFNIRSPCCHLTVPMWYCHVDTTWYQGDVNVACQCLYDLGPITLATHLAKMVSTWPALLAPTLGHFQTNHTLPIWFCHLISGMNLSLIHIWRCRRRG